ncbi:MAG: DUF222 domain-containing protein [Nakamurella sp.]
MSSAVQEQPGVQAGEQVRLPPEDLERIRSRVCAMAGYLATETCRWLDMVEELDRTHAWSGWGVKSCAHWLSWACSLSPGTAREHVRVARLLPQLPLIRQAFAAGELSFSKVREASRLAGRIDEEALLNIARVSTASQLERTVRGFRRADTDRLSQEQTRTVRWRTDEDGSFVLTARLPAEEGAVLLAPWRPRPADSTSTPAATPTVGPPARPRVGQPAPAKAAVVSSRRSIRPMRCSPLPTTT